MSFQNVCLENLFLLLYLAVFLQIPLLQWGVVRPWILMLTLPFTVYTTPALTLSHLMCSQSTNIQDLASHSPSGMVGQDAELDHSSRQDYNTQSLPSDMVRYMMTNEDVR